MAINEEATSVLRLPGGPPRRKTFRSFRFRRGFPRLYTLRPPLPELSAVCSCYSRFPEIPRCPCVRLSIHMFVCTCEYFRERKVPDISSTAV